MKQLIRLLLGLIPTLFLACNYSPSGSHYEEVNPNPAVVADIQLHEHEDTIFVRGDANIFFKVSLPDRTYFGFQIKFDDKVVSEQSSSHPFFEESFFLQSANYKDGFHTFQVLAYANSKTGSLADKKGVESLVVYRTWVLHIDNAPLVPPPPTRITSIAPEDGQLKIEWEPYRGTGFLSYELRRGIGGREETIGIVGDQNVTSWLDYSYAGGAAYYYVITRTREITNYTTGPGTQYHYPLPRILHTSFNEAGDLTVTFNASPFYKNFKQYKLYGPGLFYATDERTDTVITFRNVRFGAEVYELKLITFPQHIHELQYLSLSEYTEYACEGYGTPWGPYPVHTLLRRPAADLFYAVQDEYIRAIDATTLQVKQARNMGHQQLDEWGRRKTVISENARYLYTILDDVVHRLDPATLQTVEITRLQSILPYTDYQSISLGVSNNNRLLIEAHNTETYRDTVYLVDMDRKKLVHKKIASFFPNFSAISPDGKTIKIDERLYLERSNGSWQQTQQLYEFTNLVFHPSKPWYVLQRDLDLLFYSTATGEMVKTITTETKLASFQIDDASGYLYGDDFYMLQVYDIETGQLRREQQIATPSFVYKDKIFSQSRYIAL